MSEFTKKVIEKIQREGIEPEAGWKFTAKRSLLWIVIAFTAGLGALSLSMTALSLFAVDRHPFTIAPDRLFSLAFFRSLPLFWIVLAGTFFTLAVFEFRNTRHGYRHRMALVAIVSGIIIMIGASLLSAWGADAHAERIMQNRFPGYARMAEQREMLWSRPEDGFLSGTVETALPESVSIIDREGNRWEIPTDDETIIRPLVRLEEGSEVKIIGTKKDDGVFEAQDIRPWDRTKNRESKEQKTHRDERRENGPKR